jgi:AcrR family transcriptional regulator
MEKKLCARMTRRKEHDCMKDHLVRQKILEATINSIEEFGIEGCTIRNIAKVAGMTFSSIHYYFESKEELVDEAMSLAISGSFEDLHGIWKSRMDDLDALSDMLSFLFDGAVRYPGITRTGLYPLLMKGNMDGLFIVKLNSLLQNVAEELCQKRSLDRDALYLKLMQAFSAILFLGISPQAFIQCSSADFQEKERRAELIRTITRGLLDP